MVGSVLKRNLLSDVWIRNRLEVAGFFVGWRGLVEREDFFRICYLVRINKPMEISELCSKKYG
jgi:hypothetical protein